MFSTHKGWIEARGPELVKKTILLEYRVIPSAKYDTLLGSPKYAQTRVTDGLATSMAALFSVAPGQLAQPWILFCSQEPLKEGQELELNVVVPNWETHLRFLGKIGVIRMDQEMKENVFSASLLLAAVHRADLKLLNDAIDTSKV